MNYCTIDFETATGSRNSACSVAVVDVVDGKMTDSYHTLIKPPGNRYLDDNIEIHGICPNDTRMSPTFSEIWSELRSHLSGKIVLAHNAVFDMSVLHFCINDFKLENVAFTQGCTLGLSRAVWRGLDSHKLNVVAEHLGIRFRHHDALEDARTCAMIPLKVAEIYGLRTLRDVYAKFGVSLKTFR